MNLFEDTESLGAERDKFRWKVARFFRNGKYNFRIALYFPKRVYQRARYGANYADIWNFDTYISGVIAHGLEKLAHTKHGVSQNYFPGGTWDGNVDEAWERQKADYLAEAEWWGGYASGKFDFENPAYTESEINKHMDWMKTHFAGLWD